MMDREKKQERGKLADADNMRERERECVRRMQIRKACTAVKYSHAGSHSASNWCIIDGRHSF